MAKTVEIKGTKYFLFPYEFIEIALTKIWNTHSFVNGQTTIAIKSQEISLALAKRGIFKESIEGKVVDHLAVSSEEFKWIRDNYDIPF